MPEKIQLLIHNPCHEQWDNMMPDAEGRFCGSCQRTVVDLTMMSDQELLAWFAHDRKDACGRVMQDQLNRDLVPEKPPKKSRWALWWQLLVAGLLMSSKTSAQAKPPKAPTSQSCDKDFHMPRVLGKMVFGTQVQIVQIVDSATQKPIPGASVQVDDDPKFLIADSAGKVFILYHRIVKMSNMKVSSIGYAPAAIPVDRDWLGGNKTVQLSSLPEQLPVVSVVGYPTERHSTTTGTIATVSCIKRTWTDVIKDTLLFRKSPLTIYPNPVTRGASITLSLRMDQPGDYMIQLYSSAGAIVESMRIEGVDGARTELMNIPGSLAAGVYFMRVFHMETGKMYTKGVVVL
ncbi:MAG TPA: T9SS type A sorting domain-containing protein [Puia sp.]|nr:T9SS type A sorting domain-containing protein [Puia sp.]